jgi:hypothetical protein
MNFQLDRRESRGERAAGRIWRRAPYSGLATLRRRQRDRSGAWRDEAQGQRNDSGARPGDTHRHRFILQVVWPTV